MSMKVSLSASIFFQGLEPEIRTEYAALFHMKKYSQGEVIVSQGDVCKSLFFISTGVVALQKYAEGGEYVTLEILEAGSYFGEESAILEDARYYYSVEALSEVTVFSLPTDRLKRLIREELLFVRNYARILRVRIKAQDQRITLLSQKTNRQRVACYFLMLSERQGNKERICLPASREVTAKFLALPRPSFSRELKAMEESGWIRVKGREVFLLQPSAFEDEIVV